MGSTFLDDFYPTPLVDWGISEAPPSGFRSEAFSLFSFADDSSYRGVFGISVCAGDLTLLGDRSNPVEPLPVGNLLGPTRRE